MDSWTFNKIAGAVLGTALLVFALKEVAGLVYHPHMASHDKPGFLIEVAEATEGGGETTEAPKSIGTLLATADVAKGATEAKACTACHDVSSAGANKTGPGLWNVVGRKAASAAGYAYSPGAVAMADKEWTYEALNEFLINPKGYVKGTKMAFGGVKNDTKRANIIAYLGSLSDAPKPFPAP